MYSRELFIHRMDMIEAYGNELEPGILYHTGTLREGMPDDDEIREQDKRFIKCGQLFAKWFTDEYIEINETSPWWDHIAKIVEGKFPLEKLPDHVRDLARDLYYT